MKPKEYERWSEDETSIPSDFINPIGHTEAIEALNQHRRTIDKTSRSERSILVKLNRLGNVETGLLPDFDTDEARGTVQDSLKQLESELALIRKKRRLEEMQE
ncbi:hypothetical protein BGX34_006429, partial [Mortierella sp. NVP85]